MSVRSAPSPIPFPGRWVVVAAVVALPAAGCGPSGCGPSPPAPPADPFESAAAAGPAVLRRDVLNGGWAVYRPGGADRGPLTLEIVLANRTGGTVEVREPILPGPLARPGAEILAQVHDRPPRRTTGGGLLPEPSSRMGFTGYWPRPPHDGDTTLSGDGTAGLELLSAAGAAAAAEIEREMAAGTETWTPIAPGGRITRRFRLDRLYRFDRPLTRYELVVTPHLRDAAGALLLTYAVGDAGAPHAPYEHSPFVANFPDPDARPPVPGPPPPTFHSPESGSGVAL